MTKEDLGSIVAHRGFHNNNDQIHNRPLENTLSSFEQIWTAGISLCECDIAMTRDGKIVMAHDETFERLALVIKVPCSFFMSISCTHTNFLNLSPYRLKVVI